MALRPKLLELYDFLRSFMGEHGYAPTITEIRKQFQLNSPATVHEHLSALEREGYIRRIKHIQRGIEIIRKDGLTVSPAAYELPLRGIIRAGRLNEAVEMGETISIPPDMYKPNRFVLRVDGDSMQDEQIIDGDFIVVEKTGMPWNGQKVAALVNGSQATVKKFYHEGDRIRLQPANENYEPIIVKAPDTVEVQGVVVGLIRKYKQ